MTNKTTRNILLIMLAAIMPLAGYCLPEADNVESGRVSFAYPDPLRLEITADDQAVINFRSFNIGENEAVTFIQPGSASTVLSRITGSDISRIFGSLTSNGILFLVNPQGIHFGAQAQVNVPTLVMSTLEISTNNFLSRNYIFEHTEGKPYSQILNEGRLIGNDIALIGSSVDNRGIIQAKVGRVQLASGDKVAVSFGREGLIGVAVDAETSAKVVGIEGDVVKDALANSGSIEAGQVLMNAQVAAAIFERAVNQEGIIKSTGLVEENGVIRIVANRDIQVSGTLEAAGGKVEVESGKDVAIDAELKVAGDLTVKADANIKVSADVTVESGGVEFIADNDGDGAGVFIQAQGTEIVTQGYGGIRIQSSTEAKVANLDSAGSLSLESATAAEAKFTHQPDSQVKAQGSFILASTVRLIAANTEYEIGQDLIFDGAFQAQTSRMALVSELPATVKGENTFYDLAIEEAGKTVRFQSDVVQTVTRKLTFKGEYGKLLVLDSTEAGKQWKIFPAGESDIAYVLVGNSLNIRGPPLEGLHSDSLGNNNNWELAVSWQPKDGDIRWSNPGNWDTGRIPQKASVVVFGQTNPDGSIDSLVDEDFASAISELRINKDYSGTITLQCDLSIADAYLQAGGTLQANNNHLLVKTADFAQTGGNLFAHFHLILDSREVGGFSPLFAQSFRDMELEIISSLPLEPKNNIEKGITTSDSTFTITYILRDNVQCAAVYTKTRFEQGPDDIAPVKQSINFVNPTDNEYKIDLSIRSHSPSQEMSWDNNEYLLNRSGGLTFSAYEKTSSILDLAKAGGQEGLEGLDKFKDLQYTLTRGSSLLYAAAEGRAMVFDFSDVAGLNHQVRVEAEAAGAVTALELEGLVLKPKDTLMVDPQYSLSTESYYNVCFSGKSEIANLGSAVAIGDLNDDGASDLVMAASSAMYGGVSGGSVWVIYSTLLAELAETTGNTQVLTEDAGYNIRFDGQTGDQLGAGNAVAIGDVNGDGKNDLVIGCYSADNGATNSGSAYVIFSSLLDDTGDTSGNIRPFSASSNYNIRYDGAASDQICYSNGAVAVGDVNGDGKSDLVLAAPFADNNFADAGSLYIMFSTLISDVGETTGNVLPLSTASNYNIRFDGSAASVNLGLGAANPGVALDDVNGDGKGDMVAGSPYSQPAGARSGAIYVMFSTLIDDVGQTTGNNMPLSTTSNFNVRYDGVSAHQCVGLTGVEIGDLNADSKPDLIFTGYGADYSGADDGAVWVIFSTLLDDVGEATAQVKSVSTAENYNVRFEGPEQYEYFGRSVAIGDVNGDGKSDLICGSTSADNNGSGSGSVWVIFSSHLLAVGESTGNRKDLATTSNYNIRYDGTGVNTNLGYNGQFCIGDVNADGKGDLVLGEYAAGNNGSSSGSAYVIFSTLIDDIGATTGNNKSISDAASYNLRYDGSGGDSFTSSNGALTIGDVNGDGQGDLVLANIYADNNGPNAGSVSILFSSLLEARGESTGTTAVLSSSSSANIRYDGYSEIFNAGNYLATGDVNSDGINDLVIATSTTVYNGSDCGSVWVIFSTLLDELGETTANQKNLGLAGNYNIRYDGAVGDLLGNALIGDVNGDGFSDLVLNSSLADNNGVDCGSVYVIFSTLIDDVRESTGNVKPLSTAANYSLRFDGSAGEKLSNNNAVFIADVNADAHPDLVLGTYLTDYNGADSGSVWVVFSTLIDDIAETTGNIKPLSSESNFNIRFDGPEGGVWFTYGDLKVGDVNGDNKDDIVIGADSTAYNGLGGSGAAWVIFSTLIDDTGQTTGNIKPLDEEGNFNIRFEGAAASDGLTYPDGIEIGDVNGDGKSDLILGAYAASNNGDYSGSAWVIFSSLIDDAGETTGNLKHLDHADNFNIRFDGAAASDLVPYYVNIAADINGDGKSDLLLGSSWASNNGTSSGSLWCIFSTLIDNVGQTTGNIMALDDPVSYNVRYDGTAASDLLTGNGAVKVGDFNGDGKSDLVIGAYGADTGVSGCGSAWVIFSTLIDDLGETTGNNKPLSQAANYNLRYDGAASNEVLTSNGRIALSDINNDGKDDLILCAPGADNVNGTDSGIVYVIFGKAAITWTGDVSADWDEEGNWDLYRPPNSGDRVILPAAATTALSSAMAVSTLTVAASSTLNTQGNSVSVSGDLVLNGVLNAGTSTINIGGSLSAGGGTLQGTDISLTVGRTIGGLGAPVSISTQTAAISALGMDAGLSVVLNGSGSFDFADSIPGFVLLNGKVLANIGQTKIRASLQQGESGLYQQPRFIPLATRVIESRVFIRPQINPPAGTVFKYNISALEGSPGLKINPYR